MSTDFIIIIQNEVGTKCELPLWTKITLVFQFIHLYYSLYFNPYVLTLLLFYFIEFESSWEEAGTIIIYAIVSKYLYFSVFMFFLFGTIEKIANLMIVNAESCMYVWCTYFFTLILFCLEVPPFEKYSSFHKYIN